jgi:ElaB/YqjD/DUF883 family membrane-anchored ribosome-binding protein
MDSQGTHTGEFGAVVQDVKDLKNDSAALAGRMKDKAVDGVNSAKDSVNGTLGRIEDSLADIWNTISKTSTDSYEAVERNVERRPITSILAAFAAGAALGWVLDRRR